MRALALGLLPLSVLLAASPGPGVSQELARSRAAVVSAVSYNLSIELREHAATMPGHASISFDVSKPGDLPLDFRGQTSRLSVNGTAAPAETADGHILLPGNLLRTGRNTVDIDFTSEIAEAGRAITRVTDPVDGAEYLYTLFVPMDASLAFPCFDQPDLKGRFTLEARVPVAWTVVANTRPLNPEAGLFRFPETHPISTYLFAFAAGPFEKLDAPAEERSPVELRLYVRKSMLARAREEWPEVARYTRQGMEGLAAFFAQPYPFPKYDQVLIPGFPYGGMEHAGETFLREDGVLFRAAPNLTDHQHRAVTVLHELAHQWFGDFVTMRWFDDLWLKEGFAQYMAFHTLADIEPPSDVWKRFYETIKPLAYRIDSTPGTTPIYQQVRNLADAKSAYGAIVYEKAPSLLRVLEYKIGTPAFRTGIRAFLRAHAYGNAAWSDLIGAFAAASHQDLKKWADAWVTQRGMPVVSTAWSCAGGKVTSLKLAQRDSLDAGHLWPISTAVALGARTVPVTFDTAETDVAAARGIPCPEYVFANTGDHAYGRFLPDERSLAGLEKPVTDPLERALHWGALWDAVRETTLAPASYVNAGVAALPGESDLDIAESLLDNLTVAIRRYSASDARDEASAKLEAILIDRMKRAASRDFRIAYFRAFYNLASMSTSLDELGALLAGKDTIEGVPLQQRDRWNLISTLVRRGAPEAEKLVPIESERDRTEDGRRSAYAALAGVATAENKKKYFADYVADGPVPEDFITASLGPFNSFNQAELTLPYLGPALDSLPQQKKLRKIFFINDWLAAWVSTRTSPEAGRIVTAYLERPDLDPDLRLKILEAKDELDRTLRIRARWP
jgi:aminopeptidase N